MTKIPIIKFKGEYILARLTPEQLIRSRIKKRNLIRQNPKGVVYRIAKTYQIEPNVIKDKIENRNKHGIDSDVMIKVNFIEIDITVTVFSHSSRSAWRKLALQLHRIYTQKLSYI